MGKKPKYVDQTKRDNAVLVNTVRSGIIEASAE
jgi:hypothetical protein